MNSFHRLGGELLPPPRAVPLPRGGRSLGRENRELAEYRRARDARPFVPDVITTTFQEGARRVIGATAKPLYPIDGKAEGLDRRSPKTSLFEGGGPPRGRWKEFVPHTLKGVHARRPLEKILFKLHMLHMHHMPDTHQAYDVFSLFLRYCVLFPQTQPSEKARPR